VNDIDRQVLAAFQIEHKEHIEGIRSLVDDFERTAFQPGDSRFDEAFRLAHSLKGGARVCDLRTVERLGHQLEALFSSVRQGELAWRSDVVHVAKLVLDAVEDWMAALAEGGQPPEPDEALAAIDYLLAEAVGPPQPTTEPQAQSELQKELRAAFAEEYTAYVESLRQFLLNQQSGSAPAQASVEEAFRNAHSLYCASQAAELVAAQGVGKQLVEVFAPLRHRQEPCEAKLIHDVLAMLEELESVVRQTLNVSVTGQKTTESKSGSEMTSAALAEERPSSDAKSPNSAGTVRVQATSLDHLVRSSAQLLSELNCQDQVEAELGKLSREVDAMRLDRRNLRHLSSPGLDGRSDSPHFGRLVNYLEGIDRRLESLARQAQRLHRLHSRHEWLLRSRGQQIHESAQQARMIPVESVCQGLRKMVRDLAKHQNKQVDFSLRGLEQRADRLVLQALKDPLIHVLRNAVVHGVESVDERIAAGKPTAGQIQLTVETTSNRLRICIADDGHGLDEAAIRDRAVQLGLVSAADAGPQSNDLAKLVLQPGFSTQQQVSELAGRGMGLSVVQEAVTRLQGEVRVSSQPRTGTRVEIEVPHSVSTRRVLLVRSTDQTYAIGVSNIEQLLRVPLDKIEFLEGKPVVMHRRQPIALVTLRELLSLSDEAYGVQSDQVSVVILRSGKNLVALGVDALLAERETLVQELTGPAAAVPHFSGALLLGDGSVALVLNPQQVIERPRSQCSITTTANRAARADEKPPLVLVVDDSFTTRTLEKSILEAHGFEVQIAVDGVEALALLRSQHVDLVISDIEMPRMDGFELLEKMKADNRLKNLPIVLVTSRDKTEDREIGLNLGANAYIVKQKFNHQELLDTIRQIL